MPALRERDLDYLTNVDHHDHEALVVTDANTGAGVAVARFVRTGPDVAEPAIVVADDWQGRGVGGALLDALAARAREEGITRFDAPVLATNTEAIRLLSSVGQTSVRHDGRELQMSIELPEAPGAEQRPRGLLRHFAEGALEPARSLLDFLWPRRPGTPHDERRNVIVVGTDGTEHAVAAVDAAAALAAAYGASVDVVGAHRFLPSEQHDVTVAVQEAAGALRARGLEV